MKREDAWRRGLYEGKGNERCGGGREGFGENEFWDSGEIGGDKEEILQGVVRDEYLRQ